MTQPDELKSYQIENIAKSVHGYQIWQCMAKNKEEAIEIVESGQAVIIHEELEIQDSDFDYDSLEEVTEAKPEYGTTPDLSRILKLAAKAKQLILLYRSNYQYCKVDNEVAEVLGEIDFAYTFLTNEDHQLIEADLKE